MSLNPIATSFVPQTRRTQLLSESAPAPPPPSGTPPSVIRAHREQFLQSQVDLVIMDNIQLRAQLASVTSERNQARTQLAWVTTELEALHSTAHTRTAELEAQYNDLRSQFALVTAERDGHQARADQAVCDLRKVTSQLQATQAKLETVEKNLDLSDKSWLAAECKLKAERKRFTAELQAITKPNQAITERNQALQAELQASTERNKALQAELQASTEHNQALQTELQASTEHNQALQAEVQASTEHNHALQASTKPSFTFDASHVLESHDRFSMLLLTNLKSELAQNSRSIHAEYSVALFGKIENALKSVHSEMTDLLIAPRLSGVPVLTTTGHRFHSAFEAELASNPKPLGADAITPALALPAPRSKALVVTRAAAAAAAAAAPRSPATSFSAFLLEGTMSGATASKRM